MCHVAFSAGKALKGAGWATPRGSCGRARTRGTTAPHTGRFFGGVGHPFHHEAYVKLTVTAAADISVLRAMGTPCRRKARYVTVQASQESWESQLPPQVSSLVCPVDKPCQEFQSPRLSHAVSPVA